MTALGAYLKATDNAFYFQITEETPDLDAYFQVFDAYLATNNWRVMRGVGPEIDVVNKIIYLRGADSSKNRRVHRIWGFSSDAKAQRIVREIDIALTELVAVVDEYFNGSTKSIRIAPMTTKRYNYVTPSTVKKARNGTFNSWKPIFHS